MSWGDVRWAQGELGRRRGDLVGEVPFIVADIDEVNDIGYKLCDQPDRISPPFDRCVFVSGRLLCAVEFHDPGQHDLCLSYVIHSEIGGLASLREPLDIGPGGVYVSAGPQTYTTSGVFGALESGDVHWAMPLSYVALMGVKRMCKKSRPVFGRSCKGKKPSRSYFVLVGTPKYEPAASVGHLTRRVSPHLRRGHLRTLRDGRVIRVRSSVVHKEEFSWSEHGKHYKVVH